MAVRDPYAVAARAGRLYVTDSGNKRVCIFDEAGRYLYQIGDASPSRLGCVCGCVCVCVCHGSTGAADVNRARVRGRADDAHSATCCR
eukprot:7378300-Prymnesium_polylepis.1